MHFQLLLIKSKTFLSNRYYENISVRKPKIYVECINWLLKCIKKKKVTDNLVIRYFTIKELFKLRTNNLR